MEKPMINFNLAEIADKKVQAKVDKELTRVIQNILDPNTEAKKKRSVTLKMSLTPNKERTVVDVDTEVKSTMVPENSVSTMMMVGRDINTGEVAANELKSGVPGQTYIDPNDSKVKLDDGTPVDEVETETAAKKEPAKDAKPSTGIIDFQKKQQN